MARKSLKSIVAVLVMVCAISGLAASSASATPKWKVAGAFLGAGASRLLTGTSTSETWLTSPLLRVSSPNGKCSLQEGKIFGSNAGVPGTATVRIQCKEAVVDETPVCTAHSPGEPAGTITTNALAGELVWLNNANQAAGIRFLPEVGNIVVEIEAVGACALAGTLFPVTGEVISEVLPENVEAATGEWKFPPAAGTTCTGPILKYWTGGEAGKRVEDTLKQQLKVGKNNATLCTKFGVELNPKEKFGVFNG
jgi:hypothetical protein